jgi:hypothetical protein
MPERGGKGNKGNNTSAKGRGKGGKGKGANSARDKGSRHTQSHTADRSGGEETRLSGTPGALEPRASARGHRPKVEWAPKEWTPANAELAAATKLHALEKKRD